MREKLFRSWNKFDNKFIYFKDGLYNYDINFTEGALPSYFFNWDNAEQFTGLKDKNGNKVFENDIILWGNSTKSIVEWGVKRKGFIIKYEYVDYEIYGKKYHKTKYYNIGNSKDIEVVGNIYETKKDSV